MKKTLLSAAMIAGLGIAAFAPLSVQAAPPANSGTITFTGKVVANTCAVNVNNSGNASGTVQLPVVFTTALNTAGFTAGTTNFTLAVTGCDGNLTSVQPLFSGGSIDTTTGDLKNTAGGNNVEVQLLNGGTVMDLSQNTPSAQNQPVGTLSGGATTLNYTAQYIAVGGAATSGLVNATVAYTLTYL